MKINKEYTLSDSSVNSYGFRLLTSGYLIEQFVKNPVGYHLHAPDNTRNDGVLVRWEDVEIKGDKVVGFPNINMTHPRAQRTIDEINSKHLNAASMGAITVLQSSNKPTDMLPGQTGFTALKWFNRECSLVDIPGNYNALNLMDRYGNPINPKNGTTVMNLVNEHNSNLTRDKVNVDGLLKEAVRNKDITQEQSVLLKKQSIDDPKTNDSLCELLKEFKKMRLEYLIGLSWSELDRSGLSAELMSKSLHEYHKKFFLEFGKPHPGSEDAKGQTITKREVDNLLKYAIAQKVTHQDVLVGLKHAFGDDYKGLMERLKSIIKNDEVGLLKNRWKYFQDKDQLEWLKTNHFALFKEKYRENFGIEYKSAQ